MANSKKTSTTETKNVAAAPVKEPKVKAEKAEKPAKKEKAPKEPVAAPEVAAPAADAAAAPEEGVVATPVENAAVALGEFATKLQTIASLISSLKVEYKVLEKTISREMKAAQKGRRRRSPNARQPSGFRKPAHITDDLAIFLGKERGAEMARTDVSKEIHKYIKDHKLQDSGNGRNIVPDAALAKLLGVKKEDKLTYFNLQKFLKIHFLKNNTSTA